MLSYYGDDNDNNYFEALIYKKGNIIDENKVKKIKEKICDIVQIVVKKMNKLEKKKS